MTRPVIDLLPPGPSRASPAPVFAAMAEALLAAIPASQGQMNALASWMESYVDQAVSEIVAQALVSAQAVVAAQDALALTGAYTAKHQGAHAAPPTVRNDGTALQAGDFYYSTAASAAYAWSGTAWSAYNVTGGRFAIVTLGEAQTADYVGQSGQSVQMTKTSAPLRVLFPPSPLAGDLFRVGNQTNLRSHVINGNGNPVLGSLNDITFTIQRNTTTFEYVGVDGWRAV